MQVNFENDAFQNLFSAATKILSEPQRGEGGFLKFIQQSSFHKQSAQEQKLSLR